MAATPLRRDTAPMPSDTPEHTFRYVESDVPAGMTLSAWRGQKARAEGRGRRSGLLRRRHR
jgi:hypothetical protein